MADLMYILHIIFVFTAISLSWIKCRNLLHPHFLFTIAISVQVVDFIIRGYDDPLLAHISKQELHLYQFIILVIFSVTLILAGFYKNPRLELLQKDVFQHLVVSKKVQSAMFYVVLFLIFSELAKRLSTTDWSIMEVVNQSLAPRGQRNWDQLAYSGNFLFSMLTILSPLAGLAAAYLAIYGANRLKLPSLILLVTVLLILITNGSRTPVVVVLACTAFLWMQKRQTIFGKAMIVGFLLLITALATSLIYQTRSQGLTSDSTNVNELSSFTYHMDDSYYRTLYAYHYSDNSNETWDPVYYFYTLASNPIPRAIWPGKPLLTPEFYGGYKLHYVTNLYLGEIVAMYGVFTSIPIGITIGLFLYLIFYRSQALLNYPMGIIAYLFVSLYIYMCVRSLINITHFIYLPLFTAVIVIWLGHKKRRAFNAIPQIHHGRR